MIVGRLLSFWDGIFSGAMLNFQGVYSTKQGTLLHCSHQTLSHSDIFQLPILAKKQDWITEPCAFVHHCVHNTLQENVEKKLPSITFPWVFWLISWWKSKDSQHFLQRPSFFTAAENTRPEEDPLSSGASCTSASRNFPQISPSSIKRQKIDRLKINGTTIPWYNYKIGKISMLKLLLMEFNNPNWLLWPTLLGSWWLITWKIPSQHVRRLRSTWSTKPPVVDVFVQNEDLCRGGHHDLKSVGEVGQAYSFWFSSML